MPSVNRWAFTRVQLSASGLTVPMKILMSIEEPRKYICWAGCTSDMIRAALGCPRPIQHV
jgi:hypothetical protein